MATAKKTASGSWSVLACKNGKYKRFTAASKREAEKLASDWQYQEEFYEAHLTVGQAIDNYIEARSAILSPSTLRAYKYYRKSRFQSIINIPVENLTQAQIQNAVNQDALSVSPKTIRNAHGLLAVSLSAAGSSLPGKTSLPQKIKPSISIPTKEQIDTLIENASEPLKTGIMLSAILGLRRSEICALRCSDFKNNTLTINKAVVRGEGNQLYEKTTKTTSSTRVLTVPPSLSEHLKKIKGEYLVPLNPHSLSTGFARLQDRVGMEHFRFHDLRHYNVSVMLSMGIPTNYIIERTGHNTENMVKTVYGHTMSNKQKEIATQLDNYFDTTFNTTLK